MLFVTVLQTMNIKLSISTENIRNYFIRNSYIRFKSLSGGKKKAKTCAENNSCFIVYFHNSGPLQAI